MFNKAKTRIKDFINREMTSRFAQLSEKYNNGNKLWENQMTINLPSKQFINLPDVSNHKHGLTYIKPGSLKLDKEIDRYIEKDIFPLPATEDRENYAGARHFEYWLSGLRDYLNIKNNLHRHCCYFDNNFSIYDMGCASGRVIRHFLCQERGLELWASDINSNHVEWVKKYLDRDIKIFQNNSLPHLPMEDNYFNLIYAFSVFTHIDAFEAAWLLELKRILKPGGFAYLTIHSDNTWAMMRDGCAIPIYEALLTNPDFSPDLLKSNLPKEKVVYRWTNENSYRANVFHDIEYIKDTWGKYFEILEILRAGHFYQDVILLRKN